MKRFKVIRKDVRFNHRTFHTGDLLPEGFSEKDKYRVLYPSRIAEVEVPDAIDVTTPSVAEQKKMVAGAKQNVNPKGNVNVQPKASVSLSGKK